jgi:hypothetical protein
MVNTLQTRLNTLNINPHTTFLNVQSIAKTYPKFVDIYVYAKSYNITEQSKLKSRYINRNTPQNDYLHDSLRRSKRAITDYVLCNDFDLFVTFTFATQRQNVDLCKSKMSNWLDNQNKRNKFEYLIVPEFHKDGKSIHFHALFKGYKGKLTDSKIKQKGRKVYNLNGYSHGFSTAVKIDNIEKVSSYVRKYIVKDMPIFANKRRYWCSKSLNRPKSTYNPIIGNSQVLTAGETYKAEFYTKTRYYFTENPQIYQKDSEISKIRSIFPLAQLE